MAYDIFISYRRVGGYETAKHLYDLLSRDGYSVSFDIDTLRNGDFDVELLKRVEECTDFVLILNKGAFDRTIDPNFDPQKDWLRQELAHALKLGKNIIPIMLNGFTEFPDNLPADVARVQKKNGPKYDQYYFDGFYQKLVDVFFETPKPEKPTTKIASIPKLIDGTIRIETDLDCRILRFGKEIGLAQTGEYSEIKLPKGKHKLQFVGLENSIDCYECILSVEDVEYEDYIEVKLLDKYNARKAKEEEERKAIRNAYLLSLPDKEFEYFEENGKYGFKLKSSGEIAIPSKYDLGRICISHSFYEGLAVAKLNGKYGFIDKTGKLVIPLIYDDVEDFFNEGLAGVKLNGKWGYIDKSGIVVIPFKYDFVWLFKDGLAKVKLNGKCGFINKRGKEIIPLKYDFVDTAFSEGLAGVELNRKCGFIDKSGIVVIPLKYDGTLFFKGGKAQVRLNGKWFYIDKNGNRIE